LFLVEDGAAEGIVPLPESLEHFHWYDLISGLEQKPTGDASSAAEVSRRERLVEGRTDQGIIE
jgi:hypothetical protein